MSLNNLKKVGVGGGILAAITGLISALIWKYEGIISDDMLLMLLNFFILVVVFLAITILGWVISAGVVETHKWAHIPPDDSNASNWEWKNPSAMREIRKVSAAYGGSITTLLMLLWLWPPTWQQVVFCFVYGFGVGGMLLPIAYKLWLRVVVPWFMMKCGFKMVRTSRGSHEFRPNKQVSDITEETVLYGDRTKHKSKEVSDEKDN